MKCPICEKEFSAAEIRRTYCSKRCLKIKLDATKSPNATTNERYRGLRAKRAKEHIIPAAELDTLSFHTERNFLESDTFYRRLSVTGA